LSAILGSKVIQYSILVPSHSLILDRHLYSNKTLSKLRPLHFTTMTSSILSAVWGQRHFSTLFTITFPDSRQPQYSARHRDH